MTNAEYVYRQDVKEKSITKRSASKTNRTGKGPVRFPSDYLTKKERNAMNEEVNSVELNKVYTYDEFKGLSDSMQIRLINHLINKYGVGINTIDIWYFGHKDGNRSLDHYLRNNKLLEFINIGGKGGRISDNTVQQFKAAIEKLKVVESVVKPETEPVEPVIEGPEKNYSIRDMKITMSSLDVQKLRWIFSLFDPNNIEVEVTIHAKEVV